MLIRYPNAQDIASAKQRGVSPGGLIMVHGQKNGFGWASALTRRFNWAHGCIALSHAEMDEFMGLVAVGTKIALA